MRITQTMLATSALRNIGSGYANLSEIQDRLASGKKYTRASQDPVGAMYGMRYRTQVSEVAQFKRNLSEMYNFMESSDSALGEVNQALQRIRELTVQASNDTYNENDRKNIIQEIKQLSEHISSIGNTKVNDKYLFNGTNTTTAPIDLSKLDNYINRPDIVGVDQTFSDVDYQNLGTTNVEYFSGITLEAAQLMEQFNVDNEADLENKIIRIGPFEEGEMMDLPLGQSNEGFYRFEFTVAQSMYALENDIQVQVIDGAEFDVLAPIDPDSPLLNTIGNIEIETIQNISLAIPASTLGAVRGDEVRVFVSPNQEPILLTFDRESNSFIANGLQDYDPEAIQAAEVEVNGQKVYTYYEYELTEVDNPKDYYLIVPFEGKEYRFNYVEGPDGTIRYVNAKRMYVDLEKLQQVDPEDIKVELVASASPVSANDEKIEIELLKGVTISNNIRSQNVLSAELFKNIQDITEELDFLMEKMETSSSGSEISKYLDKLDDHISNVLTERANLGARINRVEMIENRVLEQEIIAKRILSENEDAEMEKVIIDLQTQESVHRAAMAVGARIIQPSLLDFLR